VGTEADSYWTAGPSDNGGLVAVSLAIGPQSLVATLTQQDLGRVKDILDDAVRADRNGEFSRIQLGSAMRTAIGRDPFTSSTGTTPGKNPAFVPVLLGLIFVAFGIGGAVVSSSLWLQLAGCAFAVIAAGELIVRAVRRFRRFR
jgi:hypothetical protein